MSNPVLASDTFQGARTVGAEPALTMTDVMHKTAWLFGVLVVTAVAGWQWFGQSQSDAPILIGALGGFVLAMVITFTRSTNPWLISAYAALEGLALGSLSAMFEMVYPGIVIQAVLGTLVVIAVTLGLFRSGRVRASAKATKVFLIAVLAYLAYSIANVILLWSGVFPAESMFGMNSYKLFGWLPLGVIIGVVVIVMASYALVLDFDGIQRAVGVAPARWAWQAAFGLMVTIVWLYIEVLRLLAILRGND